jgi:hypothetical protein
MNERAGIQAFAAKHAWNPGLASDPGGLARAEGLELDDKWVARLARLTPFELQQLATDWDAFFASRTRITAKGSFVFPDPVSLERAMFEFGRRLNSNSFRPDDWVRRGLQVSIDVDRDVYPDLPDEHAAFRAMQLHAERGAVEVARDGATERFAIDETYRRWREAFLAAESKGTAARARRKAPARTSVKRSKKH